MKDSKDVNRTTSSPKNPENIWQLLSQSVVFAKLPPKEVSLLEGPIATPTHGFTSEDWGTKCKEKKGKARGEEKERKKEGRKKKGKRTEETRKRKGRKDMERMDRNRNLKGQGLSSGLSVVWGYFLNKLVLLRVSLISLPACTQLCIQ